MSQLQSKNILTKPTVLLRLEALFLFCVCLYVYSYLDGSWMLFFATFLIPDVSLLGYVVGPKTGASLYNIFHTELWSALLLGASLYFSMPLLLLLAIIWFSHINLDRLLGIGLKYPDSFKHTHLGTLFF
ncbi:MAG: DUF4260 domain-containing protein [Verrucomicrobia bacterium]|nr:DUF4260 domain-containing protein [Verrucomicrobiota bacterium]